MGILSEQAGLEITPESLHDNGWLLAGKPGVNKFDFWHKRVRTVHFEMRDDLIEVFQWGHEHIFFKRPETILELEGMVKHYYELYISKSHERTINQL